MINAFERRNYLPQAKFRRVLKLGKQSVPWTSYYWRF